MSEEIIGRVFRLDGAFTKFEKTRIIGARALQIAVGAPLLLDIPRKDESLALARLEFDAGVVPISVRRRMPKKSGK